MDEKEITKLMRDSFNVIESTAEQFRFQMQIYKEKCDRYQNALELLHDMLKQSIKTEDCVLLDIIERALDVN